MDKRDLTYAGSARLSTGVYGSIKIAGSCRIDGDIECDSFYTAGSVKCDATIKCPNTVATAGSFISNADIKVGQFKVAGSVSLNCDIFCSEEFKCDGSFKLNGKISAKQITINGSSKIEGDCHSQVFNSYTINLKGKLTSDSVAICLVGSPSSVTEIEGKNINIRNRFSADNDVDIDLFFFHIVRSADSKKNEKCSMKCDSIVGEKIYIENTHARLVRGKSIIIGPNCVIDTVEYTEKADISPESTVTNLKLL